MKSALVLSLALCCASLGVAAVPAEAAKKPIDVCRLFSPSDIRKWLGKEMVIKPILIAIPGQNGCDWGAADGGDEQLTVRLIPAEYYEEDRRSPHFERLKGIADKAFVANEMGGWVTGFVKGRIGGRIQCLGGKANRDSAVTILKTVVRQI